MVGVVNYNQEFELSANSASFSVSSALNIWLVFFNAEIGEPDAEGREKKKNYEHSII